MHISCNKRGIQDLDKDQQQFLPPCPPRWHEDKNGLMAPLLSDHAVLRENLERKIALKFLRQQKKPQHRESEDLLAVPEFSAVLA